MGLTTLSFLKSDGGYGLFFLIHHKIPDAQHGGFVDWAVSLPDLYAEALSANGTVCEDRPFKEVIQVIMRSYGWTLTQQDWQLYQKNIRWGSTRHTEGWPREDKPRRLPPASWVVSGETNSALPWSWTSSLQSHKEPNSQCWSQPVCGILHKSMGLVSEAGVESCRTASQAHWCSPGVSRPGGVGPAKPLTAGGWKKQSADTPQAEGRSGHARGNSFFRSRARDCALEPYTRRFTLPWRGLAAHTGSRQGPTAGSVGCVLKSQGSLLQPCWRCSCIPELGPGPSLRPNSPAGSCKGHPGFESSPWKASHHLIKPLSPVLGSWGSAFSGVSTHWWCFGACLARESLKWKWKLDPCLGHHLILEIIALLIISFEPSVYCSELENAFDATLFCVHITVLPLSTAETLAVTLFSQGFLIC